MFGTADRESSQNAKAGGWSIWYGHCYSYVDIIIRLTKLQAVFPAAQEQRRE